MDDGIVSPLAAEAKEERLRDKSREVRQSKHPLALPRTVTRPLIHPQVVTVLYGSHGLE